MKAFGKILGLFVLGLLLVLVALGFALTHLFDPNDYKEQIRQLARDKAGLELVINGDIGWSLFPWLGLELHDTTLASSRTPEQTLAELRMLGLSVRVLPLLRREVEMSDITVNGLNLTLNIDEQGQGNWQGIGQPAQREETASDPASVAEPAQDSPATVTAKAPGKPLKLDIDSLDISDARISYHDARSGQQLNAEGIELKTGAIREGVAIPVNLSAFFGSNQPVMRARTELQGKLLFDTRQQRYQLEDLRLSGETSGEPLQGKTLAFSAQGQLQADLDAQTAEWKGLKFTANQLRGLGELRVADLHDKPRLDGAFSIAEFNLREFLEGIGQTLPAMADDKALGKAELVTRLAGTDNSLILEDLKLQLDGSTFNGRLGIRDLRRQALLVELKGDTLDLDRYLPPASEAGKAGNAARQQQVSDTVRAAGSAGTTPLPDKPTQNAWSEERLLPVDSLRNLDARLALELGSLTLSKLPFANVRLKATSRDGLSRLDELRSELYNGRIDAQASLDLRPALPQLSLQPNLSRIPLERLLQSQGQQLPIRGLLNLQGELTSQGNSQRAWIDNLNGKLAMEVDNGVLTDANLEQQLCRAIATLNRKALSSDPRSQDTPFRTLKGNLEIRNGVASNPNLNLNIPGLDVRGNGDLDLRVLALDYRIGLVIEGDKGAMPDPACQVNQRYVGLEWPLQCRGPLELGAKACRFDKDGLGRIAARLAGDKLNQKIEEKLGDKVSPELKDALKGLFKR
ncbi:AsmA family protein [Stutzerimonas kirkiae]|uniref:AsmA family protein n=1 Tax=Stutzerimonas kirkiae TaxID=2211392 RepID=A0A4Q9RD90_9GAMM|nr:AsmA family protein [Stutzerimonas kirkiae]TBU99312.1 AsmA family protein [Stutzerimonas kirkiae]TBV06228.1 AsmA family protein [Stutzerimonas kirkiae]